MFDSIRKHQRVLQFILLLLIFPAFAFFGVSGYESFMADDDSVASVADSKVTRREFDEARRAQFERLRAVLGDQADPKFLDTPELIRRVIDELVTQRALAIEAGERRIHVTDERLRDTIAGMAGLRKEDGTFDMERYRALLRAQGMSETAFEAQVRQDLAVQALPEALASSTFVPGAVVARVASLQQQSREVRERIFRPADFSARVTPSEEQLRKYYEDNGVAFEAPESAQVEYVVFSADAIARDIAPDQADVRTFYEQNAARYTTAEERRASHILIKLEADASEETVARARTKADNLRKALDAGQDFATLAKTTSEDVGSAAAGGDLGFFPREAMVKPFADAAFALKDGEVSAPVRTDFGLHLIKLTAIQPGQKRSFEEVRPEIETELKRQQASKRFAEEAESFSNLVYEQSDSLQPAADRFKLKIQSAADVTRAGVQAAAPGAPLANRKLLAALFSEESIRSRRNTDAIDVGGNTLVSARIVDYRPAVRRPFDEVRGQVASAVVSTESRKLAVAQGEALLKSLRSGEARPEAFGAAKAVSRASAPAVAPAAIDPIFRADARQLPAFVGVDLGAQGYAIYEIVKVTNPSPESIEKERARTALALSQAYGQQAVTDFVASLKARSRIETHPERVSGKPLQP